MSGNLRDFPAGFDVQGEQFLRYRCLRDHEKVCRMEAQGSGKPSKKHRSRLRAGEYRLEFWFRDLNSPR